MDYCENKFKTISQKTRSSATAVQCFVSACS